MEKNDDSENHPIELINNHRNLASSSKKLATSKKELIENGADKNEALVKLITYKKNEIVMAKMAGHVIWPAEVIFIFFHFLMNKYIEKQSLPTFYKIFDIVCASCPFQILDIHNKTVWVRFYGDNTTGQIFKSKLMKFETFMVTYQLLNMMVENMINTKKI